MTVTFPAEELLRLRAGLAKLGLVGFDVESFPWPPVYDPARAPYRGLTPLDFPDAGIFYGRDADLVRAREALLEQRGKAGGRLFVILGASGAGKSSFLRAGLLPRLVREDRDFIVFPLLQPKDAPISGETGLAQAIATGLETLKKARPLGDVKAALNRGSHGWLPLVLEIYDRATGRLVGEGAPQVNRRPTLIIPIDQAEELYAPGAGTEAALFLELLAAIINCGLDTIAILTVRSDLFEPLQSLEALRGVPLDAFNLPPITPLAFREAILGPARRAAPPIDIEPSLVEQLLVDTGAQGADPLPLLAFTLQRLYLNYGHVTRRLTTSNYETLGGIRGSIEAAVADASRPSMKFRPSVAASWSAWSLRGFLCGASGIA
jgi:hypothetical protein